MREVVHEQLVALRARLGGDLFVGGADLAAAFVRESLIDEYRIYIHPVIRGAGKALFAASQTRITLDLVETRSFANGVVLVRYVRPSDRPTGANGS